MRIMLYKWNRLNDFIAEENLKLLGHEVTVFSRKCVHYTKDLDLASEMINAIHNSLIEAVFSFDYFPIISMVCNVVGIPYYSLVYDCPHLTLFAKTIVYNCNHVGCFDRNLVERFGKMGINTVSYIPIPVDGKMFTANDRKYKADVSFVGSLYTDEHSYYDTLKVSDLEKSKMDDAVAREVFNYSAKDIEFFLRDSSGDIEEARLKYYEKILRTNDLLPGDDYFEDVEYILQAIVLRKQVTILERKQLLSEIASGVNDFAFYSGSKVEDTKLSEALKGYVDYSKQMPSVFKNSKINLNITLRSIQSGIPLRVLDILCCGGFCLSNYQREIEEEFAIDKEIVVYQSMEECMDKIEYYLRHEDARAEIAKAGMQAINDRFNYRTILQKLIPSVRS